MMVRGVVVDRDESPVYKQMSQCRNVLAPFPLSALSHGERSLDFSMVFQVPS